MDEANPLSKTEEALEALLKDMNEYLDSHGLKPNRFNAIVDKYLELPPDQLNKLSADECAEGAYLLTQYSEYLQREVNKQQNILDWANRNIDMLVLPVINNYGDSYVKFEQKKASAILENPRAKDLFVISGKAQNHLTALKDLPYKIDRRADRLAALNVTRRKKYD